MSRTFRNRKSKVHFGEYLQNKNEPSENFGYETGADFDVGLIKSSYMQKRKFRSTARKLRHAQEEIDRLELAKLVLRTQ